MKKVLSECFDAYQNFVFPKLSTHISHGTDTHSPGDVIYMLTQTEYSQKKHQKSVSLCLILWAPLYNFSEEMYVKPIMPMITVGQWDHLQGTLKLFGCWGGRERHYLCQLRLHTFDLVANTKFRDYTHCIFSLVLPE